jgi:hypothetical protein
VAVTLPPRAYTSTCICNQAGNISPSPILFLPLSSTLSLYSPLHYYLLSLFIRTFQISCLLRRYTMHSVLRKLKYPNAWNRGKKKEEGGGEKREYKERDTRKFIIYIISDTNENSHIQTCCGTIGVGMQEGFDWLADAIAKNRAAVQRKSATSSNSNSHSPSNLDLVCALSVFSFFFPLSPYPYTH